MKKGINNKGFKALPSSVQNNILSNMKYGGYGKKYAAGGAMPMEQLTEFNEGGRHEENNLGGIPQGMNPEGQMNLVEEGETKFDAENYIYSDSLKVDKELADAFNLDSKMVGKTFADASKMAGRKKSKREGDAIEEAANNKDLENLMEAQEAFKQARIEEKLQEIAELDPNALPALMGQEQPQGDPAMGGQMQEAPMDEQAMMEQQMMAQQGGGGQPSPEEMAMMQQQQDMAMGQQESMMRSGGKLPKEILKARVQSHMSDAQADAYVKNYAGGGKMDFEPHMMYKDGNGIQADTYQKHLSLKNKGYGHSMGNGGYTTRSYAPGGFMGMNMANAGMMAPGPCGTPGNPPCPGEETKFSTVNVDRNTATSGTKGLGSMKFDSDLGFGEADSEIQALEQDLRQGMLSNYGAYVSTPPPPEFGKLTKRQERTGKFVDGTFVPGNTIAENIAEKRENIRDFRQKPNTAGRRYTKSNRLLNPFRASDNRIENTGNQYFAVKHPRATEDAEGNNLRALSNLYLGVKDKSKFVGRFGEGTINRGGGIRFRRNEFGGNLMQYNNGGMLNPTGTNMAQPGFGQNMMQGMATSPMRKGGKMCYGCGGAMHAYGGRMSDMNQMATGGEIISGIGSGLYGIGEGLLDTITFGLTDELTDRGYEFLQEKGPMKGDDNIGDMVRGGANAVGAAGGAVLTGGAATGAAISEGSEGIGETLEAVGEETGNDTWNKVGQGVSTAGQFAGMIVGDTSAATGAATNAAGTAVDAASKAGDVASASSNILPEAADKAILAANATKAAKAAKTAETASKFAKVGKFASNDAVQLGMNMGSQALGAQTEKTAQERVAEEQEQIRLKAEEKRYLDDVRGFASGGYMGPRSYGTGGGLWANIHAKRARIAAGSGETMRKPGSKGAPTAEALKNSQNALGGRLYSPGGYVYTNPLYNSNNKISNFEIPQFDFNTDYTTKDEFNNMYPDISEALEQTPMQKIAMYAPIAKNIYDATLAKSDDYNPDFVPAEFVQLDSAQAIQQAKQSNARIVNATKAKGFSNPSVMLALNQQLRGTVANIQAQYDQVNAKFKQAKLDKDNTQKQELSKIKEELAMRLKEAKNAAANEALNQGKQIAENKTANKLAALYATMGAPDMAQNFLGNQKMTKAQINRAIKKLEKEKKKLENN